MGIPRFWGYQFLAISGGYKVGPLGWLEMEGVMGPLEMAEING